MTKNEFLNAKLVSLGIPKLAKWALDPERARAQQNKLQTQIINDKTRDGTRLTPEEIDFFLKGTHEKSLIPPRPQSVGEFIQEYPWYLYDSKGWIKKTPSYVNDLKRLARKHGVTVDEWPMLTNGFFFESVSKLKLKEMPVVLIPEFTRFVSSGFMARLYLDEVFPIPHENPKLVNKITLGEFLEKVPSNVFVNYNRSVYLSFRDKLRTAGFNKNDGIFLRWSEYSYLMRRARAYIKKYKFTPQEEIKFARLLIAEKFMESKLRV